jgi:hypothetical protein
MIKKYKIIKFKPVHKESLKKIWRQYNIYLNFDKEWENFLNICDNNKTERLFAVNNFLITEFLIVCCGLKTQSLAKINCCCGKNEGEFNVPFDIYNKNKYSINKFIKIFR